MSTYQQLTREQRYQIKALLDTDTSQERIAEIVRVSPSTISRELKRNKGKWEKSLASAKSCRPYVNAESRSTKTIDESLGWDEDSFHAFAGMLISKSSLTPKMTKVYREHHSAHKVLAERIESTDGLIDQVVYVLYGLTEEEISVISEQ